MYIFRNLVLLSGMMTAVFQANAQADTIHDHIDSSGWIIENALTRNKFFGNATYITASFNLARVNEWDVNIGRSYIKEFVSGGPYVFTSRSWGAGFGRTTRRGQAQNMLKAFYEYSFFVFPPHDITIRGDYILLPSSGQHYLRPSVGFNLIGLDVLYNYSFKLNGADNLFKHGVTFRVKKFTNSRKWEKKRPVKC